MKTPRTLRCRCPSATRRGKAHSIAAGCGQRFFIKIRSTPALTLRVARIPARLPACCWRQLVRKRANGRHPVEQNNHRPTLKHQRGVCAQRRLLRFHGCGQANARTVQRRLLLLQSRHKVLLSSERNNRELAVLRRGPGCCSLDVGLQPAQVGATSHPSKEQKKCVNLCFTASGSHS